MSIQTSHDEENLKIEKSFQSHISSTSSYKKKLNYAEIITKEAIESWIDKNPDSYMTSLAASFGVHYTIILKYCKKYGISFDRTKITKESLRDYLLSHPDASYIEIADHFDTVKSTAKKAVDRYGLNSLKKHQTRWGRERISKEALELWMKGHPNSYTKEAAVSFGVAPETMSRILKKYGLRIRKLKHLDKSSAVCDIDS